MKTKFTGSMNNVVFGIAMIVGVGCASNRINLVDKGTVAIERVHSEGVSIPNLYVYQEGDDLVISGSVKRRQHMVITDRGHLDIAVFNSDRTILKQASTWYNPRLTRRKRTGYFTARLQITLPPRAIVRVVHHNSSRLC